MPIPQPLTPSRSNLTKRQQEEALAACYGVPMQTQNLSAAEIESMRHMIAQHDSQSKPVTTFDLNNPPREHYRFQKFPMMVYDLKNSHPGKSENRTRNLATGGSVTENVHVPARVVSTVVTSEAMLADAIAMGFTEEAPNFTEDRSEPISDAYAREAEAFDRRLHPVSPLDSMTKAELVALAKEIGVKVDPMSKKELILAQLKSEDEAA